MPQLPTGPDTTPTHLWNPLTEDYTTTYANDDNVPVEYVVRSQEISTFPAYIARKIANNLAQHIVLKRGIKSNYESEFKAALEEITVTI